MLTRKDYREIAEAISKLSNVKKIAKVISKALERDNPRFDKERFIKACLGE